MANFLLSEENILGNVSSYLIGFLCMSILGIGLFKKLDLFEIFIDGVYDGLKLIRQIFPPLIALMIAVGLLRSSGLLEMVTNLAKPVAMVLAIPDALVPLLLLRPISGSASLALIADIFQTYGVDSLTGILASVMMGTTETVFYVVTLYFGVTAVKDLRYVLWVALACELMGAFLAGWVVRMLLT